jgi:hypothetical protein
MMRNPDDIVEVVSQLRRDLDEFKSAQRVGGASLLTYKTSSESQYDLAVSLAAGQQKDYLITFDFGTAKGGALMILNAYYRINNPAVMANPVPRNRQTNDVYWGKTQNHAASAAWVLRVRNAVVTTAYTAYVKLIFDGTDTGTFTIQAL